MVFVPAVPTGGLAGYRFLERTYESQLEAFSRSPSVEREIADFRDRAGDFNSAEALVSDRQLLKVALGAFGLEDEIDKRAFIRRILDEGTIDPESFANRFADPRWKQFSEALGFGDFGGTLNTAATRERIVEQYRVRQFERAVGEVDVDLRLALNFRREIGSIASAESVDRSGWFEIMGSRPLRSVIEGGLNLPSSFGQLDIDAQREILEDRSRSVFGDQSPSVFTEPDAVEQAVSRFLLTAQIANGVQTVTPGTTALALLGSGGIGAGARANLFLSGL